MILSIKPFREALWQQMGFSECKWSLGNDLNKPNSWGRFDILFLNPLIKGFIVKDFMLRYQLIYKYITKFLFLPNPAQNSQLHVAWDILIFWQLGFSASRSQPIRKLIFSFQFVYRIYQLLSWKLMTGPRGLGVDLLGLITGRELTDLLTERAATLNTVVANSYYGMPRGRISLHLPHGYLIIAIWNNGRRMATISVRRYISLLEFGSGSNVLKIFKSNTVLFTVLRLVYLYWKTWTL